uniref:Uncharacterized protein n=1 Tax=Sphaerodactylus townsendi TaxID=933632 RepID=A0ACB8FR56_9SAUR
MLVSIVIGAATGLGAAIIGIPAAVGMLGFTAEGIVTGSLAAKLMSIFAIANGGGVSVGGIVAFLQSIGVAGLSGAATAAITIGGALLGAILS